MHLVFVKTMDTYLKTAAQPTKSKNYFCNIIFITKVRVCAPSMLLFFYVIVFLPGLTSIYNFITIRIIIELTVALVRMFTCKDAFRSYKNVCLIRFKMVLIQQICAGNYCVGYKLFLKIDTLNFNPKIQNLHNHLFNHLVIRSSTLHLNRIAAKTKKKKYIDKMHNNLYYRNTDKLSGNKEIMHDINTIFTNNNTIYLYLYIWTEFNTF